MLEYLIKTNLDKGFYGMDVIYAYEELNEESIRVIDKVGKVLTKKKKNQKPKFLIFFYIVGSSTSDTSNLLLFKLIKTI